MKTVKKIIHHALNQQLIIGLIFLNLTILVLFPPSHYLFEMLQSMSIQIMYVLVFFGLVFLLLRKWVSLGSIAIALVLIFNHLPLDSNLHSTKASDTNFSIAHFNVYKFNGNRNEMITQALATNAEVISFNETTESWVASLHEGLAKDYPYHQLVPQQNSFGIALFSKLPLAQTQTIWYQGIPYLSGYINHGTTPVFYVAAHTIPPTSKDAFYKRNGQLFEIQALLEKQNGPKMLIGDLNTVSWASPLIQLKKTAKLNDSRSAFDPTYPSWNKFLRIPIDHILCSKEFSATAFETIYVEGSDHLGIKGEFVLNPTIAAN